MSESKGGEGKFGDSKAADEGGIVCNVDIKAIDVSPNKCALSDPLSLTVDFSLDTSVRDAQWEIKVRACEYISCARVWECEFIYIVWKGVCGMYIYVR